MRGLLIVLAVAFTWLGAARAQTDQSIAELLKIHQSDLAAEGKALLEKEARAASFFLIGGLHGDKETPALVDSLWPTLGYQYLAADMCPWAASRLKVTHIRGSDIEELQPHLLVGALAETNPENRALQSIVELTKVGYNRALAPQMLERARGMGEVKDSAPAGFRCASRFSGRWKLKPSGPLRSPVLGRFVRRDRVLSGGHPSRSVM